MEIVDSPRDRCGCGAKMVPIRGCEKIFPKVMACPKCQPPIGKGLDFEQVFEVMPPPMFSKGDTAMNKQEVKESKRGATPGHIHDSGKCCGGQ